MDNDQVKPISEPAVETPPVSIPESIPVVQPASDPVIVDAIIEGEAEVPEAPKTPEVPKITSEVVAPISPTIDVAGEPSLTIRSDETGDKVYLVRLNRRYWIKNPETLAKLGFYLGKEKKVPFSELLQYPEGDPIDMTVPVPVMPWDKPEKKVEPISGNPSAIWS